MGSGVALAPWFNQLNRWAGENDDLGFGTAFWCRVWKGRTGCPAFRLYRARGGQPQPPFQVQFKGLRTNAAQLPPFYAAGNFALIFANLRLP